MTNRTRTHALHVAGLMVLAGLLILGACRVDSPTPVAPDPANDVLQTADASVADEGAMEIRLRVPERGGLTGMVLNRETGEPVANAQVYIEALQMGGLTNNQGRFLLLNIPAGDHTITFEHSDLGTQTARMVVGGTEAVDPVGAVEMPAEPLIIVDGVITSMTIADIGQLDVLSIEIVKAPEAEALYGSRAAGGIVQVRTRGDAGPEEARQEHEMLPMAPTRHPNSGSVTGAIVHPETGEPVESAQIFFRSLNMGGLTNNQGRFLLLNVPVGTHVLTVEAAGFAPMDVEVVVTDQEATNVGRKPLIRR